MIKNEALIFAIGYVLLQRSDISVSDTFALSDFYFRLSKVKFKVQMFSNRF